MLLRRYTIAVAMICSTLAVSTAQTKYEEEKKISSDQVPQLAQEFILAVDSTARGRWYRETSDQGISFEWKGRLSDHCTSIEFDKGGTFQDAEILKTFRRLTPGEKEVLSASLDRHYDRYQIKRLQEQWTGPEQAIVLSLSSGEPTDRIVIRYELIIRARHERKEDTERYEVLLAQDGTVLREDIEVRSLSDHMDY